MKFAALVYDVTHPVLGMIRSNKFLIRRLFGVKLPRGLRANFDSTTISLSRAAKRFLTPEDRRVFEMGIGEAALVSLSLKDRPLEISGADCSTTRVESSQQVARENQVPVRFWVSDLFAEVPSDLRFDLIIFNVPYIPSEMGQRLKLTKRLGVDGDQVWDGGPNGTEVLTRFLTEAVPYLSPRGRVLFGVQNYFVPDPTICQVLDQCGYDLVERSKSWFVRSCCYLVKPQIEQAPN